MGRLIKFELRRMFGSKLIYVITAIFTFFAITNALLLGRVSIENKTIGLLAGNLFNTVFFLYVIFLVTWITPNFICPDYSPGSVMSNVVSRGYSRTKVFLSKYIVLMIFHVFIFAVSLIVGFLVGSLYVTDFSGPLFSALQLNTLFNMLISCFATLNLHILISTLCKMRMAIVIGTFVSNPFLALIVCLLPAINNKLTELSSFIMGWYPPFAYMKVIVANFADSVGIGQFVKIDFSCLPISSLLLFVLSFGGALLVVRRKEISK